MKTPFSPPARVIKPLGCDDRYRRRNPRLLLLVSALSLLATAAAHGQSTDNGNEAGEVKEETQPTEQADAKQFVIVEGQVINQIGGGETDVTVTMRRADDKKGADPIATVTTDEYGDFHVTSSEPIHGDLVVTFTKPKYKTLVRQVHVGDEEFPQFLAEQLIGNLAITGRVTDALSHSPVAGATVTLSAFYDDLAATTDAGGFFTISDVAPGQGELSVEAKGYGREKQVLESLEDPGEVVVSLKPERIVHIKIVDDTQQPIPGVTVECYDEEREDFRTYVTDEAGKVTMRGVHFDAMFIGIRLTHEDHVSDPEFDREAVLPKEQTESQHEFVMRRAGKITGTVTAAKKGETLNGARVMTGTTDSDASPRDWTDYEGNYTITGVEPGTVVVTAHLPGYAPQLKTVVVTSGQTVRLDLQMRTGAVLQGVVKRESGDAVKGAMVQTGLWRGHTTLGLRAITAADGTFAIASAPHDEFEITVTGPNKQTQESMVIAGGKSPVVLELPDAPESAGGPAVGPRKGQVAPAFSVNTLAGAPLKLSELKGKTVLLDFWATWCGPCIVEVPHLTELYKKFASRKDFEMIGISLDFNEKALRSFAKSHQMEWPQVFGDDAQDTANLYGVQAIPATFLIGPDGKLIVVDAYGERLMNAVEQALTDKERS